jgi:nucleobase:cation symporter-1, NCS1 family
MATSTANFDSYSPPRPEKTSRSWFSRLQTDAEPGLTSKQLFLTNHDLKPVEPARRQWRHISFVNFWIADSFNINTWMIAASSLEVGLSWWQAWLCVWIGTFDSRSKGTLVDNFAGYSIAGFFIVLTGRIGAVYHIGEL